MQFMLLLLLNRWRRAYMRDCRPRRDRESGCQGVAGSNPVSPTIETPSQLVFRIGRYAMCTTRAPDNCPSRSEWPRP